MIMIYYDQDIYRKIFKQIREERSVPKQQTKHFMGNKISV